MSGDIILQKQEEIASEKNKNEETSSSIENKDLEADKTKLDDCDIERRLQLSAQLLSPRLDSTKNDTLQKMRTSSPNMSSSGFSHDVYYLNEKLKAVEGEKLALMVDHNNLIREFNKRTESHLEEMRQLKESKQETEDELSELRDLCCFLDDDRHKSRQIAKEWQRFGRHTVSVMRTELLSYQEKLRVSEANQADLVRDNSELRDLCVYLDSQRTESNTENDNLKYFVCKKCLNFEREESDEQFFRRANSNGESSDPSHLQHRISILEGEKDTLQKLLSFGSRKHKEKDKKRVSFSFPHCDDDCDSSSTTSEADRLDFPPSIFDTGSTGDNTATSSILRKRHQSVRSDISPRNSALLRLSDLPLNEDQLKDKLSQAVAGKASLSEKDISALKDLCNVINKDRGESITSTDSLNSSADLVHPPPFPNRQRQPSLTTPKQMSCDESEA